MIAGSATWSAVDQGVFEYWTDTNNWTPATVPNGPTDVATFPSSTSLNTLPEINTPIELDSMIFDPGCPSYFTIEVDGALTMSGGGIINNSGSTKVIYVKPYPAGEFDFTNSAVAGGGYCSIVSYQRTIRFFDTSSAGSAYLTADDSNVASTSSLIEFDDNSSGGTAFISLLHGPRSISPGVLSIYNHQAPGVSIGALNGSGDVLLGATDGPPTGRNLTVGTSNQYTLFTGTLQDAGKGGSLTKVGTGQFVLKGANLYNGGTLVSDGQLLVANTTGSGTGSGQVKVTRRGILGGTGVIAGSVTVGTGRGTGGKLTPGIASTTFSTLTIQGLLTFKGGGIYAPRVYGSSGTADQVQANGVTIENGARISLPGANQGTVPPDAVYTVISNTANTSISGTFSNLADGGTLTVGNNTFQANYEGGDGNDLVLTVVP
jgi:hypothetical protein